MLVLIYGDLSDFIGPPTEEEKVEAVASAVYDAVKAMRPGDFFKLERHEADDPQGLFSITFPVDDGR